MYKRIRLIGAKNPDLVELTNVMTRDAENIRASVFWAITVSMAVWAGMTQLARAQAVIAPAAAATPAAAVKAVEAPVITEEVPPAVLQGLLSGTPEGSERVRSYLVGKKLEARLVSDRSVAIIGALRKLPAGQDSQQFLALSSRVSEIAKAIFQTSSITKVTIDKTYRPGPGDRAWKFGPPDAEAPPGFEKVTPTDPRLKGVNMRGIHRPGSDPLTTSGIMGVRNFASELRNGPWRVIMITDDLGESKTALSPFGQAVKVNATEVSLLQEDPSQWLEHAVLSNKEIKAPSGPKAPELGLGVKDTVVAHQSDSGGGGDQSGAGSTTAGALMLQTQVNENRLGINWVPPSNRGDQDTYVVAIIAEPADKPPALQRQINSLDIESKIFTQALNLTEPPKAGQPVTEPTSNNSQPKPVSVLPPPSVLPASGT
jgi:hypothetical protein